ncbi:MAG: histidine kinase [Lachnospiraceae bacterium]|nr:histidine kinase [Lachnospiraceae bacterium]
MSIKLRLIIAFTFFILSPLLVLTEYSNQVSSKALMEQVSQAKVQAVEGYSRDVDDVLMDMSRLLINMSADNNIRHLITDELECENREDKQFRYQQLQRFNNCLEGARMSLMKNPFLLMIIPKEGKCFGSRENMEEHAARIRAADWYPELILQKDMQIKWLDPVESQELLGSEVFCALIPVKKSASSVSNIGVIYIEISERYIYSMMAGSAGESPLFLVNQDGCIISAKNPQMLGKKFSLVEFDDRFDVNGWKAAADQGTNMMVVYSSGMIDRWRVASVEIYETVFSKVVAARRQIFKITFALAAVFMVVAMGISRLISDPVIQLSQKMHLVEQGDLSIRVKEKGAREIRVLQGSFNRMLDRIVGLMEEVQLQERKKREAEIDALQAQINPHFLFNVLSSIRWAAAANEPVVEDMVLDLSALLKMTMKKGADLVPIKESVQILEKYVHLHNLRQHRKVSLKVFVDERVRELLLPRLLLQPLAENSIIHGLGNKLEDGHIEVRIFAQDEMLRIRVADDGIGFMPDFDIDKDREEKKRSQASFSSIGLVNVRDRVRLYYGEESQFLCYNRMEHEECAGAVVELAVSLEKVKRQEEVPEIGKEKAGC